MLTTTKISRSQHEFHSQGYKQHSSTGAAAEHLLERTEVDESIPPRRDLIIKDAWGYIPAPGTGEIANFLSKYDPSASIGPLSAQSVISKHAPGPDASALQYGLAAGEPLLQQAPLRPRVDMLLPTTQAALRAPTAEAAVSDDENIQGTATSCERCIM
jgi:hypothetical protein